MTHSLSFRLACLEEASLLTHIHQRAFDRGWDEVSFLSFLQDKTLHTLVCEINGEITGFILYRLLPEEAEIMTLAVDPHHQNKGIGSTLVEITLEDCLEKKVNNIFLEVAKSNTKAQKIYKQHGFKVVSIRQEYYVFSDNRTDDALILEYKNN